MNKRPYVIGLTGQTGAGKGEVARLLSARGAYVIDADAEARAVTRPGHPCLQQLAEAFSADILEPNGELNRGLLARRAFASPQQTERLNAVTHPFILRQIDEKLTHSTARVVLLDAPLLFQAGLESRCDTTLAVTAPESVRMERICRRDSLTPQEAAARMRAQPPESYYTARADTVLNNNGTPEQLAAQVADWLAARGIEP